MAHFSYPYSYALEKLSTAVLCLIVGEGDARDRVLLAYRAFGHLTPDQFPPEFNDEYLQILTQLKKRQPRNILEEKEWADDGPAKANLSRMKNRTASKIAEHIYYLKLHLEADCEKWEQEKQK